MREVVYFCAVREVVYFCAVREVVYFLHPSSPREMPPGRHASHANLTDLPKLRPPPVRL